MVGEAYRTRALPGAVEHPKLAIERYQLRYWEIKCLNDREEEARRVEGKSGKEGHTKKECSPLEIVTLLERLGVMSNSCPDVCWHSRQHA